MGMTDPIADMLTRIRNANKARFKSVNVFASQMNINIAKALKINPEIIGLSLKWGPKTLITATLG